MKVSFMNGLTGCAGKYDGVVYYYDRTMNRVYARKKVYPALSQQHEQVGTISSRIYGLKPSRDYQLDLGYYLLEYNALHENRDKPIRSWSSLYLRLMYNMARSLPGIDLRTLTREMIFAQELPCRSVRTAVVSGLLAEVPGWERLDREM